MVERKNRVTHSTPPNKTAGTAQSVPEADSNRVQGNSPAAIGSRRNIKQHSNQTEESQFATNRADTSDADDPNDGQTLTS